MIKILITGITGFLGSKIAEKLISENFQVLGLKRSNSDAWRCRDFYNKISWIAIEDNVKQILLNNKPDLIIHCAWTGVNSDSRNNWTEQVTNITLLTSLLEIAAELSVKKIIFLGSQAEYGRMCEKVNEENKTEPLDAYSGVKLSSLAIVKAFCTINNINWVWLRVFSVFGEKENDIWLIPSLIKKMQNSTEIDLTEGKQKYAYLYINDFANIIYKIVVCQIPSGIYNVSGDKSRTIKKVVESLRSLVNPSIKLNFGVIPYRPNQSMWVEGDISKLADIIGEIEITNFEVALSNTIDYYRIK